MSMCFRIGDCHLAVMNDLEEPFGSGVYKATPEEIEKYFLFVRGEGRIKYTPPPGTKIEIDFSEILRGHSWERSSDQTSPLGTFQYDDSDGYSEYTRSLYTCPLTHKQWVTETTRKISGY